MRQILGVRLETYPWATNASSVHLTLCISNVGFTCKDDWRGPGPARCVTSGFVWCKLLLASIVEIADDANSDCIKKLSRFVPNLFRFCSSPNGHIERRENIATPKLRVGSGCLAASRAIEKFTQAALMIVQLNIEAHPVLAG